MKCQLLFSRRTKKNIFSVLSAELAQRVVKIKINISRPSSDASRIQISNFMLRTSDDLPQKQVIMTQVC